MNKFKIYFTKKPNNVPKKFWFKRIDRDTETNDGYLDVNKLINSYIELENKLSQTTNNDKNDLTLDELVLMIRDPKYWRDKDAIFIGRVTKGFQRIYGDK